MAEVGRPLKFKTVKDLDEAIQTYFDTCIKEQWFDEEVRDDDGNVSYINIKGDLVKQVKHIKRKVVIEYPTVSGLAFALEINRHTLLKYEEKDEFSATVDRAKRQIEALTEAGVVNGKINPTAGTFVLKNNWSWKDEIFNTIHDARLTPEEKAKMDTLLLNKKDDGNKPESIKTGDSGNKGTA